MINLARMNFYDVATAPYNFVSLPEKVLPAPIDDLKNFAEYMTSRKLFSGEITLEIEALTPLFIGGNGSESFAPADKPIIPGSSLRGMFRNIFKIVTCGAFRGRTTSQKKGEDFNDEHIYYRCLMGVGKYSWTKDLNRVYNGRMVTMKRGKDGKVRPVKNARPGFLIRTRDNKYFIAPSLVGDNKSNRIPIRNFRTDDRKSSRVEWRGATAYIFTGFQKNKNFIRTTKIDYVDWSREHWAELPDEVQTSYANDRNRRGFDLLDEKKNPKSFLTRAELERLTGKNLPDVKTLIPCHYLEENGQVTAFGHGQCFRIPYKNRIGDAVKIAGNDSIDFADLIFGMKNLASRVYFEDATPEKFSTLPRATTHPLMQPNPTSYQLYLKQSGGKLNHWDSDGAQIRGCKFYWHNAAPDWKATQSELNLDVGKTADKRLTKEMTPLNKGSRFTSKIRFKNLNALELGALMMIFNLNGAPNAAYKIGQGKPFGFGSIKIASKLFIEDAAAYGELFDVDGWKNPYREENPAAYLDAFKKYVAEKNMAEIWRKVIAELNKILDWSQTRRAGWSEKIKSMSGDVSTGNVDERFKQREVLPPISTIFEVMRK